MDNPDQSLQELEQLLQDLPSESLPPVPRHDDQRTISYGEATHRFQLVTDFVVRKLSLLLTERKATQPFKVCSIGCGNGYLDKLWMSKLNERIPNLKIQYVGIDIEQVACDSAKRNLTPLKCCTDVKILCCDIENGLSEEKFDFILSVNTFYFFKCPEEVLKMCKRSVSPKGVMILSIAEQWPVSELFCRFWKRHFHYEVCYPPKLTAVLKRLEIIFSDEIIQDSINLTECFQDNFATKFQKSVLNNITQVETFNYPEPVVQMCIRYLKSAAVSASGSSKKILPVYRHFFTISF